METSKLIVTQPFALSLIYSAFYRCLLCFIAHGAFGQSQSPLNAKHPLSSQNTHDSRCFSPSWEFIYLYEVLVIGYYSHILCTAVAGLQSSFHPAFAWSVWVFASLLQRFSDLRMEFKMKGGLLLPDVTWCGTSCSAPPAGERRLLAWDVLFCPSSRAKALTGMVHPAVASVAGYRCFLS